MYNEWLPDSAALTDIEQRRFALLASTVAGEWQERAHMMEGGAGTLKRVSAIYVFLASKTPFATSDLELIARTALSIILASPHDLFVQIRWGEALAKILRKYRHSLNLTIEWQPLYHMLLSTHLTTREHYVGAALGQIHLSTFVQLVKRARRFFPPGSAAQIWVTCKPAFQDLASNDALQAAGLVALFLPTTSSANNAEEPPPPWRSWVSQWMALWGKVPNCPFWAQQWASLLTRCAKHLPAAAVDWEPHIPLLYTRFLAAFGLPVGTSTKSSSVQRSAPAYLTSAFRLWDPSTVLFVAKAIVWLLGTSTISQLEALVENVEQYYHPSNGGAWTSGLEKFLRNLTSTFLKRLTYEQRYSGVVGKALRPTLEAEDRRRTVVAIMRLVDRAQYSKNSRMAGTAASCTAGLAYVAPEAVLPLVTTRFHLAVETVTATHQLESALTALALCARPLLLVSTSSEAGTGMSMEDDSSFSNGDTHPAGSVLASGRETLAAAMMVTLAGIDANDPPKTLASLHLYFSVLSSVGLIGNRADGGSTSLPLDWSVWLDEFLSRILALLSHLEGNQKAASRSFLMEEGSGSTFRPLLELIFCRLTPPLLQQVLKKMASFVASNYLPAAATEIACLMSAITYARPEQALQQLLVPLGNKVLALLEGAPRIGFTGLASARSAGLPVPAGSLSPVLETSVVYHMKLLSSLLWFAGPALVHHKELLQKVLAAAFDTTSSMVNDEAQRLLTISLNSLLLFYPTDMYRVEESVNQHDSLERWLGTKGEGKPSPGSRPSWHLGSAEESAFAQELLQIHLHGALGDLKALCQLKPSDQSGKNGGEKDAWRVALLRLLACLDGVQSCLPDFLPPGHGENTSAGTSEEVLTVVGSSGTSIGSSDLREEIAKVLHEACQYFLKKRADDTVAMLTLTSAVELVLNPGHADYSNWSESKATWSSSASMLTETRSNFLYPTDAMSRQRPRWLVVEKVFHHLQWRASQAVYRQLRPGKQRPMVPAATAMLMDDLLLLSLNQYKTVRVAARSVLEGCLKRHPVLIDRCLPKLLHNLSVKETGPESEERVVGVCSSLTARPIMRRISQDWLAMASFLNAVLSSAHHASIKAQGAIAEVFIFFVVRFAGVPSGAAMHVGEESSTVGPSYKQQITEVMAMVSGSVQSLHWRYNLMANATLLLLVPPPPPTPALQLQAPITSIATAPDAVEVAPLLADHFAKNLLNLIPPARPISVAALPFLLPHSTVRPGGRPSLPAVQQSQAGGPEPPNSADGAERVDMSVDSGAAGERMPMGASSGGQGPIAADPIPELLRARMSDVSYLRTMILHMSVDHNLESGETSGKVPGGGSLPGHMMSLLAKMARVEGEGTVPLLRALLLSSSLGEWPRTKGWLAAAQGQGFSSHNARFFELLVDTLGANFLEPLMEVVREAVAATTEHSMQCIAAEALAGAIHSRSPAAQDAWQGALWPVLKLAISNATVESAREWATCVRFAATGKGEGGRQSPPLRVALLAALREEMPANAASWQLAKRLVMIGAALGEVSVGPQEDAIVEFRRALLAELQRTMASPAQQVRECVGGLLALECAAAMWTSDGASSSPWHEHRRGVEQFLSELPGKAMEAARSVQASAKSKSGGKADRAADALEEQAINGVTAMEEDQDSGAIKFLETVLHMSIASIKSGDAVHLAPTVVGLLPALLAVQETHDADLSFLAKLALAYVKDLELTESTVPSVVTALVAAARADNWHTRAASLSFLQSFAFRNAYIVGSFELVNIRGMVLSLLSDPQIEVRELACTTLAGLIKAADPETGAAIRSTCLKAAGASPIAAKGSRNRSKVSAVRPGDNGAARPSVAAQHGAVLGLSACILSQPYDVPPWIPDMLMVLSRYAQEPPPVRTTVTRTFGDFKRTHADTWLLHKDEFTAEQLEVLSELTSSASYFV